MPSLQEYIALGEYETGLNQSKDDQEEIIRLPLLLRLLSQSQDDLECLEDRAAKFSQAEHIHVLACHLAPAVCRAWKRSFSGKSRKRKVIVEQEGDDDDDDGDILMKVEETEEQQEESAGVNEAINLEETPLGSAEMEDSLEVVLQHTLQELYTKSQSNTAVLSEDSILFQPTGGAVLASLMHYAPQLRHKKVAQLIVRSGHCAQYLLKCLAVNCPAAQYTLESVLPGFMGNYEDDLDAVACDWIANPAMIQATEQVGNLLYELAKAPSNILYCKALVWAMIQLNRHVMETSLTGVPLLVATVLAVTATGNDCDTLLQRLYESETDEQILFVFHHRDDLLRLVATFLDVPEIVNEHFLDCTRTFERTKMNGQATNQAWKNPIVILQSWKAGDGVEKHAVVEILKLYLESQTHAEELAKCPIAADLFSTGVALVEDPVPLVHAIALERMCLTSRVDSPLFQIRLLYCFAFLEAHPGSPFCFNPRNLPLRQILLMAESLSWGHALVRHIQTACSETIHIERYFKSCHVVDGNEQIRTRRSLQQVVKCAVLDMDDDGQAAESAFLDAAKVLSDSDLTTTTVASLLARKGSALTIFDVLDAVQRSSLYLEVPFDFMEQVGLRRLIIFILQLLLEVNAANVWKKARTPEVAAEYIVSEI